VFIDNKTHTSMAGTGAICHTACSRAPGTVVNKLKRAGCEKENFKRFDRAIFKGLMGRSVVADDFGSVVSASSV